MAKVNLERLREPFPVSAVKWRVSKKYGDGTATVIPYLGVASVDARLDEVFGSDGWSCTYIVVGNGFLCTIGYLREDNRYVEKTDGAQETNFEAFKGGLSDARKRAAAVWGVGRYLAFVGAKRVPIDEHGRFTPPDLPKWALPEEK